MVNILIWNVNALIPTVKNINLKHGSLQGFFNEYKADIICLQETKLVEEKLARELACVEGFESFWAFSQKKLGYSGVATYVRDQWSPVAAEIDSLGSFDAELNGEGRVVLTDHGSFVLLNVYVPNAGRRGDLISERADLKIRFLHALKEKCDSLIVEGRKVILVGDLNVAASTKDCHPAINWARLYHKEELSIMYTILRQYTDVWRKQNPHITDCYTVWDEKTFARSRNEGLRIDYVLVPPSMLPDMGDVKLLDTPHKWSDHAALFVRVSNMQPPPEHDPVPDSSKRMKQFDTRRQRSIAAMFAGKAASPKVKQKEGTHPIDRPSSEQIAVGHAQSGVANGVEDKAASESLPVKNLGGSGGASATSGSCATPPHKRQKSEGQQGSAQAKDNTDPEALPSGGNLPISSGQDCCGNTPQPKSPQKRVALTVQRTASRTAEQSKRDKGQQGIKSFFTKTA